jgi:Na+/pantothenate symporter
MNAMTKIKIPTNAKTRAATMLPSGTRFILFASSVMVIASVNGAVRTGIITDGLRNVLQLIDSVKAPTTVLAESGGT